MTASASATSRFSNATPSGCVRSSVMSILLRFINWNHRIFSYFCSAMKSARRSVPRHQSGYWQASTLMISAPRSPKWRAAVGPAHPMVRSTMRISDSGRRPAGAGPAGRAQGELCQAASSSPASGAVPPARGGVTVRYWGRTGASKAVSPMRTGPKAPRWRWTGSSSSSSIVGTMTMGSLYSSASSNHSIAVRVFHTG